MKESSWNKVVGVLVILFGIFGLIGHAKDIYHPAEAAQMTSESKQFLRQYVSTIKRQLDYSHEVSADALLKIDGFEQVATSRAYIITENTMQDMEKELARAEVYLKSITTVPVDEYIAWYEVPYALIAIIVIVGGFLMLGEKPYRYKVFYGGLLSAVVYDIIMLATDAVSVWGMAIFVNILFCLIIYTANRSYFSGGERSQS